MIRHMPAGHASKLTKHEHTLNETSQKGQGQGTHGTRTYNETSGQTHNYE